MRRTITVIVEIPALAALVEYLKSNDQVEIDAITAEVAQATARLNTSATALASANNQVKEK